MKDMYVMSFIEVLESMNGRDHGMIEKCIGHNMALPSYSRRLDKFLQSLSHYHFWKIFICFLNLVSFLTLLKMPFLSTFHILPLSLFISLYKGRAVYFLDSFAIQTRQALTTLFISQGSPETQPVECVYQWKDIYFRELVHVTVKA